MSESYNESISHIQPTELWPSIERRIEDTRAAGPARTVRIVSASIAAVLVVAVFVWAVSGLHHGFTPAAGHHGSDGLFTQTQAELRHRHEIVTRISSGAFTPKLGAAEALTKADATPRRDAEAVLVWLTSPSGGRFKHHAAWLVIAPPVRFPIIYPIAAPSGTPGAYDSTTAALIDATTGKFIFESVGFGPTVVAPLPRNTPPGA
jgi:hypothetical protein